MKKSKEKEKSENELLDEVLKYFASNNTYGWEYYVDGDFRQQTDCEKYGCNEEGICRCGWYENPQIYEVYLYRFLDYIISDIKDEVLKYCIERIINFENISISSFNISVVGGYYGQEIEGIYLYDKLKENIYDRIYALKNLSNLDRIKYVLNLEYDSLDFIEKYNNHAVEEIDLKDISFDKAYKNSIKVKEYQETYNFPRGIFFKEDQFYKLIDGACRIKTAKYLKMKSIKGIVLLP